MPRLILYRAAIVYARLGDADASVAVLERLLAVPHIVSRAWLRIDRNFDPIRGDPGFRALLER